MSLPIKHLISFTALAVLLASGVQAQQSSTETKAGQKENPIPWREKAKVSASKESETSLNNLGVKAMIDGDFKVAIERLEDAVLQDPGYTLAKRNLAIAFNNYALQLRSDPKAALSMFHRAFYLDPHNATTLQNVDNMIKLMGKDPKSFQDRVDLGDQERSDGDFIGALLEYRAALQIKPDASLPTKISEICSQHGIPNDTDGTKTADPDPGPYTAEVSSRIKRAWHPPNDKCGGFVVTFEILQDGTLSNLKVDKSSGSASWDRFSMKAVQDASPFSPPPKGTPGVLLFSFDGQRVLLIKVR